MARTMAVDAQDHVFRAVITKKFRGLEPFTAYEGPYTTLAAARARVTYWVNLMSDRDDDGNWTDETWASGYVQAGIVNWTPVG